MFQVAQIVCVFKNSINIYLQATLCIFRLPSPLDIERLRLDSEQEAIGKCSEDISRGYVLSLTVGTAEALTVWADLCELLGHQSRSSQNGRAIKVSIIQKLGWETRT